MKPFLIGICGGSGSGKTTFLNELKAQFSTSDVCVVSQDDYYRPREEQKSDENGIKNFDLPYSIDDVAFHRDLCHLLDGKTIQRQEYTFNNEKLNPKQLVFEPAPLILVEGLFIFHFHEIKSLLNLKVFLHAKENLKVIRRIKRDRKERNYPLDDVLYRYQAHVSPAFEQYIEPYKEDVDIIVNNNVNFNAGLAVLSGFMKNFLAKTQEGVNTIK